LDLLRNSHRKYIIDDTLGKWLRNWSVKRFDVVESTDHALHPVGLAVDEAMEEQKDALGIAAREIFLAPLAFMNLSFQMFGWGNILLCNYLGSILFI